MKKLLFALLTIAGLLTPTNVAAQAQGTITIDALNEVACTAVRNQSLDSIGVSISGTLGTLTFQEASDGLGTGGVTLPSGSVVGASNSTTTSTGVYFVPNLGIRFLCVKATSWTAESASIVFTRGYGSGAAALASSTTTDADDASIAVGQTNTNQNSLTMAYDGSVWRRLTFGTAGTASTQVLTVQGIASMTPLAGNITQLVGAAPSATNPLPVRITNGTAYQSDDVADGAASSGNPVPTGTLVETSLAGMTVLDDGDRGTSSADADRAIYVRTFGSLADIGQERDTITTGTSTAFNSGLAAPGANVKWYLSSCTLANSSATNITVDIQDGASGAALWTFPVPATGGATHTWDVPLEFTANTAVAYQASTGVTTLTISCNGFKSKL